MSDYKDSLYKIIGEKIKSKRENLDLRQLQLSKKLNISRSSISNIEVGRHQIPLFVLYDLSKIINCEVKELLPDYDEVINFTNSKNKNYDTYLKSQPLKVEEINEIDNYLKKLKL